MLWGNKHYISGFDSRKIDNAVGYAGVGMSFTCWTACTATAIGFYVDSVSGSAREYYVGIKYADDENKPIGSYNSGWVDDEYKTISIDSDGWINVVDSTGWGLNSSPYAISICGTRGLSSPDTSNYIKILYSTPATFIKIYNGSSDPNKKISPMTYLGVWGNIGDYNPIYYIKGKINGIDGAYQDGCCYTELITESLLSDNFNLTDGLSKNWASILLYLDATTYGYSPVLTNVYIRGRAWSGRNQPNDQLHYLIYDSSDALVASSGIFTRDGYTDWTALDWSGTSIAVYNSNWLASAISLNYGQTYRFVFRPYNTLGYYSCDGIKGTTVGVSEYGFYQGIDYAFLEKSSDSGSTWTYSQGRGTDAPVMFQIISIAGSVTGFNGQHTDGLIGATIHGFSWNDTTDETGSYDLIVNSTSGDDNIIRYSFYNFQMTPYTTSYGSFDRWSEISTSNQNSLKEFDEKWWDFDVATGRGKHYAFRKAVDFSNTHSTYAANYVHSVTFQTGYMVPIYTTAEINEGIHLSMDHGQIFFYKNKSYMAMRNSDSEAIVTEYDYINDTYGTKVNLGYINDGISYVADTHFQAEIVVDHNGYPWCFFSKHGGAYGSGQISYRKCDTQETVDGTWSAVTSIPFTFDGTYLRPRINPVSGDIWLMIRDGHVNSETKLCRFVHSTQAWEPPFSIAKFNYSDGTAEGWSGNNKSIYMGGFRFDENGYAYITLCYLQNYSGTPQHEVANQCFYTTGLSSVCSFYSIDGTQICDLTAGEHIHWNTLLTTCSLNFYTNTSDPATGITYPKGGTNEDHMQFLDGNFDNGSHTIKSPAVLWIQKYTNTGYPSYPVITYWHTAALSYGWKNKFVCGEPGDDVDYWQASPRLSGGFAIGDGNIAHYYGFFEPKKNTAAWNTEYSGFPFIHYYSNNDITTSDGFITETIFKNSFAGVGNGIMRMEFKDNYVLEGLICNRSNIYHYFERKKDYGYVRNDKNDICVVYNNSEIPCVVDNVTSKDSHLYFTLQNELSENSSCPYNTHYYIYYGDQSTAWIASSNPSDIWSIYDNFEQYETDKTVDLLTSPPFQWSIRGGDGAEYNLTHPTVYVVSHSSFSFLGLGGVDPSVALSGQKSCMIMAHPAYATAVCATTLPSSLQNSLVYSIYVKGKAYTDQASFAGLITSGGTAIGLSCSRTSSDLDQIYGKPYNGITFKSVGTHRPEQYAEYKFEVSNEFGVKAYKDGDLVFTTSIGKSGVSSAFFGTRNAWNWKNYFYDFVRISTYKKE